MYAFGFDKRSPPVLWNVVFTHKRSIRAFFLCRQTVWKRRLFVSAVYMWTKTTTMTTNGDEVEDNNNDRQWWICVVSARVPYELLPQETPPFFYHFSSCRFSFRLFNKFCSNSFSAVALSDFYHRYFFASERTGKVVTCYAMSSEQKSARGMNAIASAKRMKVDSFQMKCVMRHKVDATADHRTLTSPQMHEPIERFVGFVIRCYL